MTSIFWGGFWRSIFTHRASHDHRPFQPQSVSPADKAKPKKANKVEAPTEEVKGEPQANATGPITPRPKAKVQPKNAAQPVPPKAEQKPPEQNKGGKGSGKGKRGRSESRFEKRQQQCIYSWRYPSGSASLLNQVTDRHCLYTVNVLSGSQVR